MKNVNLDPVNKMFQKMFNNFKMQYLAERECSHIPPAEGSVTDYGRIYSSCFPELESLLNVGRSRRLAWLDDQQAEEW